ncbi:N-6 DNA methylase [Massilia atriviolacea]|uniref:site-specific DNA-methyltransferase (adenine-specific) n=1 Tax=Massilia atriviolacea TaxID=2495579 RepID=A0A430HKY6_9BURK|nr:N-6 DNA methylase [Massilia atriviolacea]RSZ58217.1 hypothetical protein EJB06_14740 [Massilia atriviolacea]
MQWSIDSGRGNRAVGQFATPDWVAQLLCSRLRTPPTIAADLGIGKGALSLALAERFPGVRIVGVENYSTPRRSQAAMRSEGITLVRRDVAAASFSPWFTKMYGKMDTIICNPPFTYIDNHPSIHQLLSSYRMRANRETKYQRLDLVFLAHAMKLLKSSGEMAFILPISAFSMSRSFTNLQAMVSHFGLQEIISLPRTLYQDAEVETAVLVFRPKSNANALDRFTVYAADSQGSLDKIGQFSCRALAQEFSPITHSEVARPNSLGELGGAIARGRHSSRALSHQGVSHFHTTSFQQYPNAEISFDRMSERNDHKIDAPAREGDILIPRVGTRCLGRAAIVVSGSQYISDCIFRISVPVAKRRKIWEFISSEAGSAWQLSLARGACAKFITQRDLLFASLPSTVR